MLTWLDGILLGLAQRLSDSAHAAIGLSKFTLEKAALVSSAAFIWGGVILDPSAYVIVVIALYTGLVLMTVQKASSDDAEFIKNHTVKPPLYPASTRLTVLFLCGTVGILFLLHPMYAINLVGCGIGCIPAWVYITCCTARA
jgi:hypothetical protein